MQEIVLATRNHKKVVEIRDLLGDLPVRVRTPEPRDSFPIVIEDGTTFEENARKKAREFMKASGGWALADDSGLEVDALDGRPGVHSSRFSGPDATDPRNNRELLRQLERVPDAERTARFCCVLCLSRPSGEDVFARGSIEGRILREERGTGGFGYDPLFLVPAEGKTFAELGTEYKNRHSHRATAMERMKREIQKLLARADS